MTIIQRLRFAISAISLLIFFTGSASVYADDCSPTGDIDWVQPDPDEVTNWTCGRVPTSGDVVTIPFGVTVTINSDLYKNIDPLLIIHVYGEIAFDGGGATKINLDTESVIYVHEGGVVSSGGGANDKIVIGGIVWAGNQEPSPITGPYTVDKNGPSSGILLPVELLSFTIGAVSVGEIELNWATTSEVDFDYFELERSANGFAFEPIDRIAPKGAPNMVTNYSYTDYYSFTQTVYYRLKMVDLDESFEYSKVVSTNLGLDNIGLDIFPNPSEGGNIKIVYGEREGDMNVTFYNASGILVYHDVLKATQSGVIDFNPKKDLLPGVYFVKVNVGNEMLKKKLVVF